jgi:hypothetical protein
MRLDIGRICAVNGVCPGSYGVVTGIKSRDNGNPKNDILRVTYDGGRTDAIHVYMIRLVESERDQLNID